MGNAKLTDQPLFLVRDTRDGSYLCAGRQVIPRLYRLAGAKAAITKLSRFARPRTYVLVPATLSFGAPIHV